MDGNLAMNSHFENMSEKDMDEMTDYYMSHDRPIQMRDIVLHTLSGLYFVCENKKHERWMNMNPYYKLVPKEQHPPKSYFDKN